MLKKYTENQEHKREIYEQSGDDDWVRSELEEIDTRFVDLIAFGGMTPAEAIAHLQSERITLSGLYDKMLTGQQVANRPEGIN